MKHRKLYTKPTVNIKYSCLISHVTPTKKYTKPEKCTETVHKKKKKEKKKEIHTEHAAVSISLQKKVRKNPHENKTKKN